MHRSIKPANVLLTDDGARLSDLGLAEALHARARPSPASGRSAPSSTSSRRSCWASAAAVRPTSGRWASRCTARSPAQGVYGELPDRDALSAVRKVLSGKPVLSDDLDAPTREVIEACLQPEPADRPPTRPRWRRGSRQLAAGG